jgi:hypothetical protein
MARLQSNTTIYGTANVQGTLYVGSVSSNTSTSNITGSLVVTGGIGLTGPIYSTGSSLTINNGLATVGNTGTIYLGDSSFSKTAGGSFIFNSGIQAGTFTSTTFYDAPVGSVSAPSYKFSGTNVGMYYPSANTIGFATNTSLSFAVTSPYNSVNYLQVFGNTTGNSPVLLVQGTDASANLSILSKSNGYISLGSTTASDVLRIYSNNYLTGGSTSFTAPALAIFPPQNNYGTTVLRSGSQLYFQAATTVNPAYAFQTGASVLGFPQTPQFTIGHTTSAVNYLNVTGGTTGNGSIITNLGNDANVAINLLPKGNAAVMITGNTVGYIAAANSIYVGNRVGFANSNNISVMYQTYNPATNSFDIVLG